MSTSSAACAVSWRGRAFSRSTDPVITNGKIVVGFPVGKPPVFVIAVPTRRVGQLIKELGLSSYAKTLLVTHAGVKKVALNADPVEGGDTRAERKAKNKARKAAQETAE